MADRYYLCPDLGHVMDTSVHDGIEVTEREIVERLNGLESSLAASQGRLAELERNRCECGAKVADYPHGCPTCGAPQCCQACCKVDAANARAETAELERDEAVARTEEAEAILPALRRLVEVAGRVFGALEPYPHLDPIRGELVSAIDGVTRPEFDRSDAGGEEPER